MYYEYFWILNYDDFYGKILCETDSLSLRLLCLMVAVTTLWFEPQYCLFYTSFMSMTYAFSSFTFGLRCVYGARRLTVSPLSYGLRAAVATA